MKNRINQQNNVICFSKIYNKWVALIGKTVEDSIKYSLIITPTTTGIFFALKATNVKPPKASLDAIDIMKLPAGVCGGVLLKDHAVYKKWTKEWYNNKYFMVLLRAIKLHNAKWRSILASNSCLYCSTFQSLKYRSSVTLRWATASSRLNT